MMLWLRLSKPAATDDSLETIPPASEDLNKRIHVLQETTKCSSNLTITLPVASIFGIYCDSKGSGVAGQNLQLLGQFQM